MNQQRTPAKRMSYREWKIRKCLRLARNWVLFLAACGGAVALMATGILWLLPKAHALIAGPVPFAARAYSADGYVCDTDDARLVVVNANLPLESEPAPELAVADDATGEQLETEAAAAYRSMAEAAQAAGVELNLVTGWQDADTRTAAYEARLTAYQTENSRLTGETAAAHTASLQPTASTSEQGTGYCADILSPDCTERSEAFAETRAYEWLTALPRTMASSSAGRRSARVPPAWSMHRGTGGMWGSRTPAPSAKAAFPWKNFSRWNAQNNKFAKNRRRNH